MAEYTPENIGEPFRKLQVKLQEVSLAGRNFLLSMPQMQDALDAVNNLTSLIEDLQTPAQGANDTGLEQGNDPVLEDPDAS